MPVASSLSLVSVWHTFQVISTMSTLGAVKCLSMEGVVEITTGLILLKNVIENAVQVRTMDPTRFLIFMFICLDNNFCGLNNEPGLCDAYIPSYFYNITSKRCERFIYGGCRGNANRFSTLEQCEATCGQCSCVNLCIQLL